MKYNFFTGKNAKKVIYKGYKYLGKGKLGKLKFEIIDKKKFYYLIDYFSDLSRVSPKTSDKSKFKKATQEDWKYKGGIFEEQDYIEKQKPKREIVFKTKIKKPKSTMFCRSAEIRLGKEDYICFFRAHESNIIRDLQLKDGDKLIVKFTKIQEDKKNFGGKA